MGGRVASLPAEVLQGSPEGYSDSITHSDNARGDTGVNCKKSAEVIVP